MHEPPSFAFFRKLNSEIENANGEVPPENSGRHQFYRQPRGGYLLKEAFIFDLDGTLLDSMQVWRGIGSSYLRYKGITEDARDLQKVFDTQSLPETADYLNRVFSLGLPREQICTEINGMSEEQYLYEVQPKKGVRDFLEKHRDTKMCIATATDRYLVEPALKRLDMAQYFSFILTSSEVGIGKSNPEIFLQASKKLDTPVSECAVFEDALHAIKSAKSAGFYVVGVREQTFAEAAGEIDQLVDQFVTELGETGW